MSHRSNLTGRTSARVRVAAASVVAIALSSVAQAADYEFAGPASTPANYNLGSNWSGNVVPGSGDAAFINGSRIAVTDATLTNVISSLRVGSSSTGTLNVPAGSITSSGLVLGDGAAALGTINITGGSLTSTANAVLGEASTGDNKINISAGSLTLSAENYFGANGRGSLAVSGTGVAQTGRINVGNGPNSIGAISVTGGSLTTTDVVVVGLRGLGTYTQSGGTATLQRMQVGLENDGPPAGPSGDGKGKGTVTITGGTLTVNDPIVLGEQSREDNQLNISAGSVSTAEMYNGANGRGTVNLSGTGTLTINGQMHIGAGGTGTGALNVSGGNLNLTGGNGWILVGQNGIGAFTFSAGAIDTNIISVGQDPTSTGTGTQTGGTLRARKTFIVGETSTVGGNYNINAGSIDVGTAGTGADLDGLGVFVGSYNGKGVVNVSGTAAISSRTGLTLGYGEGGPSDGTLNVSSGSFSTVTAGDEGRARIGVYTGATGRLNVSGTGTVTFAGPVLNGVARGGVGVGGTGLISVTGGSLTAASVLNETGSSITQSGGTSTLGVVTGGGSISVSGGNANVTRLTQSALTVNGTGTLKIANAVTPAASTVKVLTTGGTGKLDITNNGLIVDYDVTSPITSIRAALQAGQIVGTLTPADPRQGIAYGEANVSQAVSGGAFLGTPVDSSAIVLRSRLKGDANMDGTVEFQDLVVVAARYNFQPGQQVWTGGDFNYDGNTDFQDLVSLSQNYSGSLAIDGLGSASFQADWALAQTLVPEPTSLIALSAGAAMIVRRRRSV
jgi:hypothetical protein